MQHSILLFDIDYTLFDTNQYKKNTADFFCSHFHISKESMNAFDKEYRKMNPSQFGVSMKDYAEKMGNTFDLSPSTLFQLLTDTEDIFSNTLYSDTLPTLERVSKTHILGIFSQGHYSFQKNKLSKTKILPFFAEKHIYIFPHKIHDESIAKLPKNAVVIDDKELVVETISTHMRAIHINREKGVTLTKIIDILSV